MIAVWLPTAGTAEFIALVMAGIVGLLAIGALLVVLLLVISLVVWRQ